MENNLEQLRFLENNYSIYVSYYDENIPNGIDTQEDVSNAIKYLNKKWKYMKIMRLIIH